MKVSLIAQSRTDVGNDLIRTEFPKVYLNIGDYDLLSNETIYFICTFKEDMMGAGVPNQTS